MQTSYPAICDTVTRIISKTKGVTSSAVLAKDSLQALGMDQLDLVNLILAVEKKYHITIPDDVPVEKVSDLIYFVHEHAA